MNTDKIDLFIQKNSMLMPGDRVLCALSGGADSVCLLHYLASRTDISVVAAHFNHHLRAAESDRDEAFVKELCGRMNIKCLTADGDVAAYAAENGLGIEEAARKKRYAFLRSAALSEGCRVIATAHNAQDNAETIIMNLARGAGLKGLCGIPPVRGNVIRPLLETSRTEIESYLEQNGLEHVEDSTNRSDDYSRNRVRHHVLPVLESINPAYAAGIAENAESLREDEEYLDSLARDFISRRGQGKSVPVSELLELPGPVASRVIRLMHNGRLGAGHVRSILNICRMRSAHAYADVPGMRVSREFDRLIFGQDEFICMAEREIKPGEELYIPERGLKISCRSKTNIAEIHKSLTTFVFKNENICGRMSIASRRQGSMIALEGRGCTKSLKKIYSEAKLSLSDRATRPVIYDEQGPIAVYGFGVAERCAAKVGDDVIIIEIKKDEENING